MDATSALNWLPAGITSLIQSLERTDSLAVFNVTQAVKSFLSMKTTQEGSWDNNPCAAWPKGFNSIFSSDALRDLAKPSGARIYGIALNRSVGSHRCWCDEEFCGCHHHGYGGCGDLDCVVCEPCTSEEEFDCEIEDHHEMNWASATELQCHWGFPLSGSLLSSRQNSQSPRGADCFFRGRRDSRLLGFGNKELPDAYGQVSWTARLGDSFERLLGANSAVTGNNTVQVGQGWKRASQEATSDSSAYDKRKDGANSELRACREREKIPVVEAIPSKKIVHEPKRQGIQSGNAERHSEVQREGVERKGIITAVQEKERAQPNKGNPDQRASVNRWSSMGQALAAVGERKTTAWQSGESENSSTLASNLTNKWNFRMGQNAIAEALAGGFVSLCLHPIDTLKTVVQAQTGRNRNLIPILSAIISERGIKGLYRGLGSNLASSAPTSAIYTLTYEAVKAGLLHHLPVDMSALAHCAAGGCASVATSIVYTPSECVKQQMQVNSLYRNSWYLSTLHFNEVFRYTRSGSVGSSGPCFGKDVAGRLTFMGLLRQGGLPMLYNGWGAVLCRNVPQSVIKFYTYEGLKVWVQGEQPSGTPLSTVQALAIGGVAGSTASFFTTPFDVVKTRLQTQAPGTIQLYTGVFHAFQCIAAKEGVAGLYRGLVPRLLIYVTQGALFFASYEFIKHVLAVEVPHVCIKASQIEGPKNTTASFPAEST